MRVLITGGTSGIGLELARCFARDGHELFLVARNRESLKAVADELTTRFGVDVLTFAADLSNLHVGDLIYQEVEKNHLTIDILVNNAGFATNGLFPDIPWEAEQQELMVNIVGLTHLTKLFSKDMIKRARGRILNIASIAAYYPGPLMAVYYASKAYVKSFSLSLAEELEPLGVTVSVLCPGPTKTGFARRAHLETSQLFSMMVMDAATVAEIGYRGLMQGKRVIIPAFRNRIQALLAGIVPATLSAKVIKKIQKVL